jgi:ribosomal protein S21
MLIIPIKEGENIDRALKRYKRKFDRTKTMKNLRARKNFTKPSVATLFLSFLEDCLLLDLFFRLFVQNAARH